MDWGRKEVQEGNKEKEKEEEKQKKKEEEVHVLNILIARVCILQHKILANEGRTVVKSFIEEEGASSQVHNLQNKERDNELQETDCRLHCTCHLLETQLTYFVVCIIKSA